MNAPVFPPNPAPGQKWGAWTWSGGRWVCTRLQGTFINVQVFPASAPYTPSPGLTSLTVETWGGGGGGGPCQETTTTFGGAGGGGSGGYSRATLAATLVAGGVNVTVGDGGPGGGTTTGQPGQPTSFGALCVANGGIAGQANNSATVWGNGGAGAPAGVGDLAVPGNPGSPGTSAAVDPTSTGVNIVGGAGGAILGGAGAPPLVSPGVSAAGNPGIGPGAGGSGAASNQTAGPALPGGTGGNGLCIVTETCWADTGDEGDCGCGPTGGARVAITGSPQGRGAWVYEDGND